MEELIPSKFELVTYVLSNQSEKAKTSNRRWVACISIGVVALAAHPTLDSDNGVNTVTILDTTLRASFFFAFSIIALAVSNIAFVSAFRSANKTGGILDAMLKSLSLDDIWPAQKGRLVAAVEKETGASTSNDVLQDILRTGMGEDYVRIRPVFDTFLTSTVAEGNRTKHHDSIKTRKETFDFFKKCVDAFYIFTPTVLLLLALRKDWVLITNISNELYTDALINTCLTFVAASSIAMTVVVWRSTYKRAKGRYGVLPEKD